MEIKQVLYKDIPREIFKKGLSISFPSGDKEIYFKLKNDLVDIELWEVLETIKTLPTGIVHINALGQYNYLRVIYFPQQITEEDIIKFTKEINGKIK